MKRLSAVVCCAIGALTAAAALQAAPRSREQRLNAARTAVAELQKNRTATSTAVLSFTRPERADAVARIAREYGVDVREIHHVYRGSKNVFRGGTGVLPGEPLDQALARHAAEVRDMIVNSVAEYERTLAELDATSGEETPKSEEQVRAAAALRDVLEDSRRHLTDMERRGVEIYGLIATGTNGRLVDLSRRPEILAVEPMEPGARRVTPILNNHTSGH